MAFEALEVGVDLFDFRQLRERLTQEWSEEEPKMVLSIIGELVYLGCSGITFFCSVAPCLANAGEEMLRHA